MARKPVKKEVDPQEKTLKDLSVLELKGILFELQEKYNQERNIVITEINSRQQKPESVDGKDENG